MTEQFGTHAAFDTTRWTLLGALRSDDTARSAAAREILMRRYWPPVYAALRRSGRSRDAAEELTQAFFAEVVVGRSLFERADAERGRLRTLLLTALRRFVVDQHRREVTRGHGRLAPLEALDSEDAMLPTNDTETLEQAFDRRWALVVVEEALQRCERHFISKDRAGHWRLFEARVVRPALANVAPEPLATAAARCGFGSPADGAAAVQVVKTRLQAIIREVAAETTQTPEDGEAEFAMAVAALG